MTRGRYRAEPIGRFAVLLFVLAVSTVSAGGLDLRSTPPVDAAISCDVAPDPGGTYTLRRGGGPEIAVGQTFRADTGMILDRIVIEVPSGSLPDNLSLTLLVGLFSDPEDASMNRSVHRSLHSPSGPSSCEERCYLGFELPSLELKPGQQYGFLVRVAGGRGGQSLRFVHAGRDAYSGGRPFLMEGADYKGLYDDLSFYLVGRELSRGREN